MDLELQQIVAETIEITGGRAPTAFDEDAPVLQDGGIDGEMYLVGLIGGKEVGKSALVNAIVGQRITNQTSYGPGTEIVVAYAHELQHDALARLLDREVPRQYRIVAHTIAHLRRQVLLDLPDVDSHWSSHVEITRRMLRHMLFPLWVQSVEKYADGQAQHLLSRVSAGNDPANFLFCLNKVDQMPVAEARELRDDFARRIARTLSLPQSPDVWMVSAIHPDQFDLPRLRDLLARQKSDDTIATSRQLAGQQQDRSLLGWLDAQRLPDRLGRLKRLQTEAEELTAERLGVPLLERTVTGIMDDAGNRMSLADAVLARRVARWPIVSLVHTLLNPILSIARRNVGAGATASVQPAAESLVDAYLSPMGLPLSQSIQATFATLHQTHPADTVAIFGDRKLWDAMSADAAALDLRQRLSDTLLRQRTSVEKSLAGAGVLLAPLRWLLTFGAVLWFPIVQPVLQIVLQQDVPHTTREIGLLVVQLLGATYLLKSVGFLCIYFLVLWLALRWNTNRRVARLMARWKRADVSDGSLSLARQSILWIDELTDPIRVQKKRLESLIEKIEHLRQHVRVLAA